MEMKNITDKGALNLVTAVVMYCFVTTKSRDRRLALVFAESKLLKMWCDCTHNFEYKKLRKLIIEKNK